MRRQRSSDGGPSGSRATASSGCGRRSSRTGRDRPAQPMGWAGVAPCGPTAATERSGQWLATGMTRCTGNRCRRRSSNCTRATAAAASSRRPPIPRPIWAVAKLARRFTALVRNCGISRCATADAHPVSELAAWLAEARACGVRAIATFAAGIEQDAAAVRAALTTPWSSGQAEGQINRLKLRKRQSYGRAGLDLLQQRVLLAA